MGGLAGCVEATADDVVVFRLLFLDRLDLFRAWEVLAAGAVCSAGAFCFLRTLFAEDGGSKSGGSEDDLSSYRVRFFVLVLGILMIDKLDN